MKVKFCRICPFVAQMQSHYDPNAEHYLCLGCERSSRLAHHFARQRKRYQAKFAPKAKITPQKQRGLRAGYT
jgi:hypothetical protein